MVVAGLGDSGERRVVGQVGGFHRQRQWVAKQQCSPTGCGNQARRPVATLCRWEPTAFDARALGRDPRVHQGRTWANFSENRVTSLHIDSYLQSKGHPLSALASVGDPHSAPPGVIVASSRTRCWLGWRLHLDGVSRRRSQRVDGWIWPSFASAMRKSLELTLPFQVIVFEHFIGENRADVTTRPSLFGIHHAKREGRIVTSAHF